MRLLLLATLFLSFESYAESFKIAGQLVAFESKDGLLLKGCSQTCDALKTIKKHKKIDMKKARQGMTFTNSVGSDVCAKVYKAGSLLGVAENMDRRAFCIFKDQSMVEMNSLSDYLVEKKIVKE